MRHFSWFLILALGVPGAAVAQRTSDTLVDSVASRWQAGQVARKQAYFGVQAGMPSYWRDWRIMESNDPSVWSVLTVFAGLRMSAHWTAQIGFNHGRYNSSSELYYYYPASGGGVQQVAGTWRSSGSATAVPLQVYYHPASCQIIPHITTQAFIGIIPQWQRNNEDQTPAGISPPAGQTGFDDIHTRSRTTNVHATAGISVMGNIVPGADIFAEGAINRRVWRTGAANVAPAWAPTLHVGFRCYIGGLPHRNSYWIR